MGKISTALAKLAGQRVYIDTHAFIFFLDRHDRYFQAVAPIFQDCFKQRIFATTGAAAIAEVMVHPYRSGDGALIAHFKSFFHQKNFLTIAGHDIALFDTAAMLAGQRKMKLMDALHFATAQHNGCQFFLTNDHAILSSSGLEVIQLDDLID